jgi:uncharacterized membrane protein
MSSFVVSEALVVGLKEAFKVGVVWIVFRSFLILRDKNHLIRPFYMGMSISFLMAVAFLALPVYVVGKEPLSNLVQMSFAVFLLSSAAALFHAAGMGLFGTGGGGKTVFEENKGNRINGILIFFGALFFFFPDSLGSVVFLRNLSFMKEAVIMTYASALIGIFFGIAIIIVINEFLKPSWVGSFFNLPQFLLFLSVVKLLGGGTRGFTELSLIPSVQRGIMKFAHDFVHQVLIILMVPDHLLLKTTVWNFIGIFFGPNIAVFASLFIILLLPLLFIYNSLFEPLPQSEALAGAKRRKVMHLLLSDRRRKALPVVIFIVFILFGWFSQTGESVSRLYDPEPRPVVGDRGMVLIPLHDPSMDLMDGMLHKFSLTHEGETITLLIIKKSNNALSVTLDACEICPPEGYGQRGGYVVCIYCSTPIPVDTLGQPGGCNPIPLSYAVDERFVKIRVDEIVKMWKWVKPDQGKGALP